tara:strand:- start:26805 stop:26984 length:180 start_codon:yes stop_codon:yes gene_type:complete
MQSQHQEELKFLAQLGEKKIKSIKTAYELTESELAVIIRLHQKSSSSKDKALFNLLNQF